MLITCNYEQIKFPFLGGDSDSLARPSFVKSFVTTISSIELNQFDLNVKCQGIELFHMCPFIKRGKD